MADIVLKDRNGNTTPYPDVTELVMRTVDGGIRTFSNAVWTSEKTKINGGYIEPSGTQITISPGLGVVPDFVFVGRTDYINDSTNPNQGYLAWAFGWSNRMSSIEGFNGYGSSNNVRIDVPYDENYTPTGLFYLDVGIDSPLESNYGNIRDANSETFVVGSNVTGAISGRIDTRTKYFWFAVSGIGTRMNKESEVE